MKYRIETSSNPIGLANQVNKLIDEGWRPLGGLAVAINNHESRYCQAMSLESIGDMALKQMIPGY